MSWRIVYTKQAQNDAKKLAASGMKPNAETLIAILAENPFQTPPPYEKLIGDLSGAYSRRINIQHRLVYQILEEIKTVKEKQGTLPIFPTTHDIQDIQISTSSAQCSMIFVLDGSIGIAYAKAYQ